jgi:hypothetical protein
MAIQQYYPCYGAHVYSRSWSNSEVCDRPLHYTMIGSNGSKAMGWTSPHPNGIIVPDWKRYRPVNGEKGSTMKLMRVGVDLAKAVFQVHGVDRNEKVTLRRKLTRANWLEVLLKRLNRAA